METVQVNTKRLKDIVDLTLKLNGIIQRRDFQNGLCHVFLSISTAALTTGEIGEGTEADFLEVAETIIPRRSCVRHAHDPSHA